MSPMPRMVEWAQRLDADRRPGVRHVLPEAEAAEAISAGLARGVTLVRFKASVGPYNTGETAGLDDHVAERLISLDWAEPVPVRVPAGDEGAEDKAINRPPADRMIRAAPNTKEMKS